MRVTMSMLDSHAGNEQFARQMQLYGNVSLEDAKYDAWPILLPRVSALTGHDEISNQILHMILDESDVSDVVRMKCFPDVLRTRVMLARERQFRLRQISMQGDNTQSGSSHRKYIQHMPPRSRLHHIQHILPRN